jgi:hypothetical protein
MMNLHGIVRGAINALHPDIAATLYRSTGKVTTADGSVKSVYAPGVSVSAQKQSAGPETLFHRDMVSDTEITDKFYLFADPDPAKRVAGIYRPLSRGGDMLQLEDETWWLVNEVLEDFSLSGWVSVLATLQVIPPDFSHSEWWTP